LAKKLLYCASNNRHLNHFHIPYIKMIEEMGIKVDILSKGEASDFPNNNFHNVNFEKSITSFKNIKVLKNINKLLKKERYDYIYLNTSLTAALVRLAIPFSLVKKTKVINLCHGYFFGKHVPKKKNSMYISIEKLLYKRTDHIITMNSEDFEYTKTQKLCKSKPYFVNGMGLNKDKYKFSDEISKGETINLLYIAEHSERKNHIVLFCAMQHAIFSGANLKLYLAGDGKLFEENKHTCESMSIQNNVVFLGYIKDIEKVYPTCDYAISTSKIEGLPFNILEALASGLPCIVSDVKGNRDLINNSNGYIYPLGDIDKLKDILISLEKTSDDFINLRQSAAKSIKKYHFENASKEFKKIFDEIFA